MDEFDSLSIKRIAEILLLREGMVINPFDVCTNPNNFNF